MENSGDNINIFKLIMGVEDASILWNLSEARIKKLCQEGEIIAEKISGAWIIDKRQPNPRKNRTSKKKDNE